MQRVRVLADAIALAAAAAETIAAAAARAVAERGAFSLALSGGTTPQPTYRLLATPSWRSRIDWSRTNIFWGDERLVPASDPRSNAGMAQDLLLDHLPLTAAQIHAVDGTAEPQAAVSAYAADLRTFFAGPPKFDLILLGLGSDGHTASLFPDLPLPDDVSDAALIRRPDEPFYRLTLTIPLLCRARQILFLVSGADKAAVLRRILGGAADLPAARVAAAAGGEVLWLLDAAVDPGLLHPD